MPRKCEKGKELLPVVKEIAEEGNTQQQIADKLKLEGKQVTKELLKHELNVSRRTKIATITEAKALIDDYIFFYNHQRIQAKLTPPEQRCQYAA